MGVEYKSSSSAAGTSLTLPAHAAGDLILIFAYRLTLGSSAGLTPPSEPSAGGSVPQFTTITTGSSVVASSAHSFRLSWGIAGSSSSTSGTWTNASRLIAVILSGQAVNPVGGNAAGGSGNANSTTATAPAITLSDPSGSSQIIHFFSAAATSASWNAAASGYTARLTVNVPNNGIGVRVITKDTTSTDGSVNNALTAANYSLTASVEIVAPPPQFWQFL